jgi:hypothetical protein
VASAPQPSNTPNDPAGYDTSTNLHGLVSSHVGSTPNGYTVPSEPEDHMNPRSSISHLANGTVVTATHTQTPTGYRASTTVPAAPTAVSSWS